MTNNRELSQIANLIEVLDTSKHINIKSQEGQNIGIGTTIPAYKVQIVGDVGVNQKITATNIHATGVTTAGVRLLTSDINATGVTTSGSINVNDNLTVSKQASILGLTTSKDLSVIGVTTTASFNVGTGGTILSVTSDGSIGIGTSLRNVNINSNVRVSGVLTATSVNITSGINYAATAGVSTVAQNLTGTPSISITNLTANGFANISGVATFNSSVGINTTGNLSLNSGLLTLNHSGTNANISNTTGKLILSPADSNTISFERVGVATLARFTHNNGSELFFNGTKRFETTNTGATVTGNFVTSNLTATTVSFSGISTFTSGPVLIGAATSTQTAAQPLQVTGGAYVSGNLGIGATNPTENLHILKSSGDFIRLENSTSNGRTSILYDPIGNNWEVGARSSLATNHPNSYYIYDVPNAQYRQVIDASGNILIGSGLATATGTSSQPLQVTGGAYVSGNLGIGTTNPITKFHLQGNSYFDGLVGFNTTVINGSTQVDFGNSNTYFGGYVNVGLALTLANVARVNFIGGVTNPGGVGHLLVSSNNSNTPTTIFSGTNGGRLSIFAGGMTASAQRGGQIDFVGGASTTYPGELLFRTGIGTLGTEQPITARLDTSGIMYANTFTSTSDERLKANIEKIDDPFVILNEVKGVRFNWKDGGDPSVGVIAQDVEKVLPEAVKTDPEGMKSVCYDMLIGVLIEAIKDQQKRIDDLEARLDASEQL